MSDGSSVTLEELPVEVLHRIFDHLDAFTLIFNVRPVSRRFRAVTGTYNRYEIDFQSLSKSHFHALCRLIRPAHVISLVLSGNDRTPKQIDLFLSSVRLRQFLHLRSIKLLEIHEHQLAFLLKRVNVDRLNTFSVQLKKYDDRRKKTTKTVISSIVATPSLHQLEIYATRRRLADFSWPNTCSIERLIIDGSVSVDELQLVLEHCPVLHSIVLKEGCSVEFDNDTEKKRPKLVFSQLKSLVVENFYFNMDDFEVILAFLPSLHHLKLLSKGQSLDGKRWESFVQKNLPQLQKFEFDFYLWRWNKMTLEEIEQYLVPFRSSFWIEQKKWFVTAVCETAHPYQTNVYTLPKCASMLKYEMKSPPLAVSTFTDTAHHHLSKMERITTLHLTVNDALIEHIMEKNASDDLPLFPNVKDMKLSFFVDKLAASIEVLTWMVDMSKIVRIEIQNKTLFEKTRDNWINVKSVLKEACHLSELIFETYAFSIPSKEVIENIISIIPGHIKHLSIALSSLDQIELILDRCKALSSIKFYIRFQTLCDHVIQWFNENFIGTQHETEYRTISIWLGKRRVQSNQIETTPKRFKWSQHQSTTA